MHLIQGNIMPNKQNKEDLDLNLTEDLRLLLLEGSVTILLLVMTLYENQRFI